MYNVEAVSCASFCIFAWGDVFDFLLQAPVGQTQNKHMHALQLEAGDEQALIKPSSTDLTCRHLTPTLTISSEELTQDSSLLTSWPKQCQPLASFICSLGHCQRPPVSSWPGVFPLSSSKTTNENGAILMTGPPTSAAAVGLSN